MIRLTVLALDRVGLVATIELLAMAVVIVCCLAAAVLSPAPADVAVIRCDGTTLVWDADTRTIRTVACP